jgi:hypothetical protein
MSDWADEQARVLARMIGHAEDGCGSWRQSISDLTSALRAAYRRGLQDAERVCRERLSSDSWLERETVACADAIRGLAR